MFVIWFQIGVFAVINAAPAPEPEPAHVGKYKPKKYDGKYLAKNEGIPIAAITGNNAQNGYIFASDFFNKHKIQIVITNYD